MYNLRFIVAKSAIEDFIATRRYDLTSPFIMWAPKIYNKKLIFQIIFLLLLFSSILMNNIQSNKNKFDPDRWNESKKISVMPTSDFGWRDPIEGVFVRKSITWRTMPILKSDIGGMSEGLYDVLLLRVKVKDIFFSVTFMKWGKITMLLCLVCQSQRYITKVINWTRKSSRCQRVCNKNPNFLSPL